MSDAERQFWAAFEYSPTADRWLLREGLAPMDVVVLCVAKIEADRAAVIAAVQGKHAGGLKEGA